MTDVGVEVSASARELAREVLIHGPISRAELGRRLGLSPASLTRLSKPLLDRGLFVERAELLQGATGRPARPLDVRPDAARFIGVKLTGEGAFGVVTDLRANALATAVAELPDHDVDRVVATIGGLVDDLASTSSGEIAGVGVSVGGNAAGQRTVARAPFLGWRDVPLAELLEARLGLPVTIENDVIALTVAEQWFGAVRGTDAFAVVTIGAGVGYGLVMHDRVVVTPDTGLGLGGHLPLDPSGPRCAEGHAGCSTAMLSIPSITAQLGIALGREVGYAEVIELARGGQPVAVAVAEAAGRALGRMIALVANLAMVDAVVLSGEGVGLWPVVERVALATLAEDRDPDASPVRLHVDDAGFDAWARGAAAVAIQASLDRLRIPVGRG